VAGCNAGIKHGCVTPLYNRYIIQHNLNQTSINQISAMKKVVLGFSGGLDTSYCVKYLTDDKGYEVHSIIVNTGGFTAG
jgi:PP-loop superfamily ATP-utilizing enzyme